MNLIAPLLLSLFSEIKLTWLARCKMFFAIFSDYKEDGQDENILDVSLSVGTKHWYSS